MSKLDMRTKVASDNLLKSVPPPITGITSLDETIEGLCEINRSEKEQIKPLLAAYLFGEKFIARMIEDIANSDTVEFIEGIGMLVKQNQIKSYDELATFLDGCKKEIVNTDQCTKVEINI